MPRGIRGSGVNDAGGAGGTPTRKKQRRRSGGAQASQRQQRGTGAAIMGQHNLTATQKLQAYNSFCNVTRGLFT